LGFGPDWGTGTQRQTPGLIGPASGPRPWGLVPTETWVRRCHRGCHCQASDFVRVINLARSDRAPAGRRPQATETLMRSNFRGRRRNLRRPAAAAPGPGAPFPPFPVSGNRNGGYPVSLARFRIGNPRFPPRFPAASGKGGNGDFGFGDSDGADGASLVTRA
jgi:hypothetical protein